MDGWIKIYRKLKDWEWYTDSNVVHLFIHLLLSANFTETRRKGIVYNAGQVVTSIVMLAAELEKSYPTILRCLKILSESGAINVKSTNKKTILTICKYKQYQQDGASCYKNNLDQTLEQPLDQTLEQPLELIYNKNIKKEKNVKNVGNIYSSKNENFAADKSATNKPQPKSIEERKKDFMQSVADNGLEKYGQEMCREFFDYWTESNPNGKKMRFEMQKVFEIKKRLATWNKNNLKKQNYGNKRDFGNVSTERIIAAGRAMANAGL